MKVRGWCVVKLRGGCEFEESLKVMGECMKVKGWCVKVMGWCVKVMCWV